MSGILYSLSKHVFGGAVAKTGRLTILRCQRERER